MKAYFFDEALKKPGYSYQWAVRFTVLGEAFPREDMIVTQGKTLNHAKIHEMLRRRYGKIEAIHRYTCD